jgi:hypothetical protein
MMGEEMATQKYRVEAAPSGYGHTIISIEDSPLVDESGQKIPRNPEIVVLAELDSEEEALSYMRKHFHTNNYDYDTGENGRQFCQGPDPSELTHF